MQGSADSIWNFTNYPEGSAVEFACSADTLPRDVTAITAKKDIIKIPPNLLPTGKLANVNMKQLHILNNMFLPLVKLFIISN